MKASTLLTFFLLLTAATLAKAQDVKNLFPDEIKKLEFDKEYIENLNTPQSLKKCEEVYTKWKKEKRDYSTATAAELKILSFCDEITEDPWSTHGVACSWYCGGGQDSLSASSALASYNGISYAPNNAHDLSYKTAWVEGVKGHGIGEYLDYHIKAPNPRITEIIVVNGYVKNETAWRNNSRVKTLQVYVDGKPYAKLNLEDSRSEQHFKIEPLGTDRDKYTFNQMKTMPDWKMRFEITEVYPGEKFDDTVITEIYFDGIDVHCLAAGSAILMANGSSKPIEQLKIGDQVMSVNPKNGQRTPSTILELDSPTHHNLVKISFNNGSSLTCTADHPLLNADGHWTSFDPEKTRSAYRYDHVKRLQIGSKLFSEQHTEIMITNIEVLPQQQPTFTIVRLDRNQSFIANGIVVGTEPLREMHKTARK